MAAEVAMPQQQYYFPANPQQFQQPFPAGYVPRHPGYGGHEERQQQQQHGRRQQKRRRGGLNNGGWKSPNRLGRWRQKRSNRGNKFAGAVQSNKHRRLATPRTVPWAPSHSMCPEGTPSSVVQATPSAHRPADGWEGESSRLNLFATNPGLVVYDSEDDDAEEQHAPALVRQQPGADLLSQKDTIIDQLRDENLDLKERIFLLEQEVERLKDGAASPEQEESDQGVAP